jgi:O-antigen/teichoic acid export membrane protein
MLVNQPGGYAEMGVFNAANQWRTLMTFFPAMMMQAALPVLASAQSGGSTTPAFRRSLQLTQSLMVMVAFPLGTLLMFGSEALLRLYGREFPGSGSVLVGAVATALVQSIGAATGPAVEARGRMWFGLAVNLLWGLLFLAFVYVTVGRWGANANAFGQVFAYVVITVWVPAAMRHELPQGMFGRVLAALAVALAFSAAAVITPASIRLALAFPAAAIAAIVAGWVLADRSVTKQVLQHARDRWLAWRRGRMLTRRN